MMTGSSFLGEVTNLSEQRCLFLEMLWKEELFSSLMDQVNLHHYGLKDYFIIMHTKSCENKVSFPHTL